jgi:hypothetical protein
VTTFIPRFSLGEESRFEDHDSTLFCALKRKTHPYQFQLARALQKKGGRQNDPRDARVVFEAFRDSASSCECDDP